MSEKTPLEEMRELFLANPNKPLSTQHIISELKITSISLLRKRIDKVKGQITEGEIFSLYGFGYVFYPDDMLKDWKPKPYNSILSVEEAIQRMPPEVREALQAKGNY